MSELSHLDKLEAEAIYIIREVAAECEKPVMLYSIGILSGEAAISFFTCQYNLEIQRNDRVP